MRKTKTDDRERLKKLEGRLPFLEAKSLVKQYLAYQKLAPVEKAAINQQWNDYYDEVRSTPRFALFSLLSAAYKNNDFEEVKRLRSESVKINQEPPVLKKPQHQDPEYLYACSEVYEYRSMKAEIERLKFNLSDDPYADSVMEFLK